MSRLRPGLLILLALALYAALLVASIGGSLLVVVLTNIGLYVVDDLLHRGPDARLIHVLTLIGADVGRRFFIRQVLVLVFLLRSGQLSSRAAAVVVTAVLLQAALGALFLGMRVLVAVRRLRRVETRNLGLVDERLPEPPPPPLMKYGHRLLLHSDVLITAALVWALVSGSYRLVAPAAVLMVIAAAGPVLALAPQLLALLRLPTGEQLLAAAQASVLELAPTVVLYFSGGLQSVYQVNIWLETMERLNRPVLVLLRERRYLADLGETTVPVLCLPKAADVLNLEMPSARASLFVANVGKNIHLLRLPTLKSAFIGHGDSDKTASFNPFSKVYDEVWVAGEAGRQRYVRAKVGVREDEIVLVGRPQLDGIKEGVARPAGAPFTVLYAPTWEGWTEDPHSSSLPTMGRSIIELLLATAGVRVIYKPHPLTGSVDPRVLDMSHELVRHLAAAGPQHVAILAGGKTLYDCFDDSDALVSDISSVVSDYLRSGKPYFVTNAAGVPDQLFREENPSAGASYLVGPGAAGLAEGLAQARGVDELRDLRRQVRTYLLGDTGSNAMSLFRHAVDNLVARAEAQVGEHRVGLEDDDERMDQEGDQDGPLARQMGAED